LVPAVDRPREHLSLKNHEHRAGFGGRGSYLFQAPHSAVAHSISAFPLGAAFALLVAGSELLLSSRSLFEPGGRNFLSEKPACRLDWCFWLSHVHRLY